MTADQQPVPEPDAVAGYWEAIVDMGNVVLDWEARGYSMALVRRVMREMIAARRARQPWPWTPPVWEWIYA